MPVEWLDWALVATVALVASFISLVTWAEGKGRPFVNWSSRRWAIAVVLVLAAASGGLSLLVHAVQPAVPMFLAAIPLPFALCGRKLVRLPPGDGGEHSKLLTGLTVGVALLLRQLRDAMAQHLSDHLYEHVDRSWNMRTLAKRSDELYERLRDYVGEDTQRRAKLDRNIKDVQAAVRSHAKAPVSRAAALDKARRSYKDLLRLAYIWGFDEDRPARGQRKWFRFW